MRKLFLLLLVFLISCNQYPSKLKLIGGRWVYAGGYYVGDLIHLSQKDSGNMKQEDGYVLIHKNNKPAYKITKMNGERLYIESIDGKQKGEYQVF